MADFARQSSRALLGAVDRTKSEIGESGSWSDVLHSYIDLVLASEQPMFLAWGPDLTFIYNDAYAPILGVKHPQAMGRPFRHVWSDIWSQISPIVTQTLTGTGSWHDDLLIPMQRNGYQENAWFSFSYTPVKVGGKIEGVLCAAIETTNSVVSAASQEFHQRLEVAIRELADTAEIIDFAQRYLGEHLRASRVGYGEVEETERYFTTDHNWTDQSVEHFNGTHDLAAFGPEIHEALKRGEPLAVNDAFNDPRIEAPESKAAFAYLQTQAALTASLVKGGRMIAALYVHCRRPRNWTRADIQLVQDVAERTWSAVERAQAQAGRSKSDDRFRKLAELSPAIVWFGTSDGGRSYLNKRWMEFTGQDPVDALGLGWAGALHPDDRERVLHTWAGGGSIGDDVQTEGRLLGRDGLYHWFLMRAQPVRDSIADDVDWVGFDTDIDDIVRARDELARTGEAQLAARTAERDRLWNLSQDMFARANLEGMLSAVSPGWTRVLGWSEEELLSRPYATFMHGEDVEPTFTALTRMGETGQPTRFENRIATSEGGWKWIEWTVAPELGGQNFVAVGRDLSEAKARELELATAHESLRHAQKMEAVGQLTGGLAHDFNNIIAGISGSLEMITTRLAQGRVSELDRYITGASGAARRAASLTQRLLAFSRRQTLEPKPTNLNTLVTGMLDLIHRSMGPEIHVETAEATGLWTTFVDAGQLENALLNLCINARDAMPDGGKLTIETGNRWMDERGARHHALPPGQYVSLCVSDTGTGMSPEVIDRAFDPFFTTKPIGQGTGLGLSMVYGFAGQSGGAVRIYSELGKGTMVCIYLPRWAGDAAMELLPQVSETTSRANGGDTVLLVDDEPLIRMVAVEALEELGYTVLEAGEGATALKLLNADRPIDLLITDVGLPGGMNGRQLADAARVKRPDLKVLFITGYAENAVLNHGHLDQGMHVLTKPFQMEAFARKVKGLIDDA